MARKETCNRCGNLKENNYMNDSFCKNCRSVVNKEKRAKKRIENNLPAWGSGRKPFCSKCGEIKDKSHLTSGYCRKCSSERRKLKTSEKRKSQGLQEWGSGLRKIRCCRCNEIKENLRQGYCFKCKNIKERERYKKKYSSPQEIEIRKKKINEKYKKDLYFKKKRIAHRIVLEALKKGVLKKEKCKICGDVKVDAHHEDYDNPLDVIWLCRLHHMEKHKTNN